MPTLQEIDEITKGRKELEKIHKLRDDALLETDRILKQLDKARNNLKTTIDENELALLQREKDALGKLALIDEKVSQTTEKMRSIEKDICGVIEKSMDFVKNIFEKSDKSLLKVNELINNAINMNNVYDSMVKEIEKKLENVSEMVIKNSEFEKELTEKAKQIDLKSKIAEEKLLKAESLAFWHKGKGVKLTK